MAEENKRIDLREIWNREKGTIGYATQILIGDTSNFYTKTYSRDKRILYISMIGYSSSLRRAFSSCSEKEEEGVLYDSYSIRNPQDKNDLTSRYLSPMVSSTKKIIGTDYSVCTRWYSNKKQEKYRAADEFESLPNFAGVVYFPLSIVRDVFPESSRNNWYDFTLHDVFNITQKDKVKDYIYAFLKDNSTIPIMKEWISYLSGVDALKISCPRAWYSNIDAKENMFCITISVRTSKLKDTISEALKNGVLSIHGSNKKSAAFDNINNLTDYLGFFSDQLIEKAANNFEPVFDPSKEEFTEAERNFFDYAEYHGKLKYFNAQKNVIGAVSRTLDRQRSAIIVGEMGCGKTSLSIGAVYLNAKGKNTNNIVICPGHLVEKWKREIERLYPNAEVVIIDSFNTLLKAEPRIMMKNRHTSLFFVISKDTAKINYLRRPAAIFNPRSRAYCCPVCGKSLNISGHGIQIPNSYNCGSKTIAYRYSDSTFWKVFSTERTNNYRCGSGILRRSSYPGKISKDKVDEIAYSRDNLTQKHICQELLWTYSGDKDNGGWIKFPKVGWIHKDMIPLIKRDYEYNTAILENDSDDDINTTEWTIKNAERHIKNLEPAYKAICEAEEFGYPDQKVIRRYSIAKYLREKYKNQFDYLIADEVHQYSSSNSAQSNAFGDFVRTAKKTVALTGTLLNGYSDSIYPILYRMYTRDFESRGYDFHSHLYFAKRYGVFQDTKVITSYGHTAKSSSKVLPGVSPDLFTSFLLDKAIFISLSDMSNALPAYHEYPVKIEMNENTKNAYNAAQEAFKTYLNTRNANTNGNKLEVSFKVAQKMNAYPDQPFNVPPVYDKDGNSVLTFTDIVEDFDEYGSYISEKDLETLRIVKEKIDKDENVLIYVNTVNTTNCIDRLKKLISAAGIKTCVLTAKTAAKDREKWIDEKVKNGYRVLICNPSLVETGLDLLAFTNIIFYQVGYNLFTMRQASRRSLRLNQPNPVNVYFLYYANTTQEAVLSLMANKLQAAMSIEGKFTEEGLNAMSNNDSILTQVANSLVENIEYKIEEGAFNAGIGVPEKDDGSRFKLVDMIESKEEEFVYSEFDTKKKKTIVSYSFGELLNMLMPA